MNFVASYKDKTIDFVVKTPAAAVSIMKKAQLKKGSAEPNRKKVATISWKEVQEKSLLYVMTVC